MVVCPDCGSSANRNADKEWFCSNPKCPLIKFHRTVGNCLNGITKKVYASSPRRGVIRITGGNYDR